MAIEFIHSVEVEGSLTVEGKIINTGGGDSDNWDTAYGWGDHGDAGYIKSFTNNYLSSVSWNTGNGKITLNRNGLSALSLDIDGRYLVKSHQGGDDYFGGHHPEGRVLANAYLANDLGNLRRRGGSVTTTNISFTDSQIDLMFDGTAQNAGIAKSSFDNGPIVIECVIPRELRYGAFVGIGFGNGNWRCKKVKIEAYTNSKWVVCTDLTANAYEDVYASIPGNSSPGTTKFRFTLDEPNSSVRICHIWAYNYDSRLWSELMMPRAGGTMYGSLSIDGTLNSHTIPSGTGTLALTSDLPTDFVSKANGGTFGGSLDVNGTESDISFVGGSMNFKDSNNYIRITKQSASAQLGLFRKDDGGMYIGGSKMGFRLYTDDFSQKLLIDQSGNATFAGTLSATGYNKSNWDTAYGWGDHGDSGYLTSLPSHNHDDRYYTESEMKTFFNRGYIDSFSAGNLAAGWHTIATNTGDRAMGEFQIWDTASSDHQSVLFNASHHFGQDFSNDITILNQSRYAGTNFRYLRIKDHDTYAGAALQVYIDGTSNSVYVAIVGGNAQESGWVIKDWIPDATDPGDVSNWATFAERTKVDLDLIMDGGILTTGKIFAGSQTAQYEVFHTGNFTDNSSNWDTAYGWGDHGDAGYGTSSFDGKYSSLSGTPTIPTDFVSAKGGGSFTGDITIGGTTGTGGNALSVNRGSDGAQALRIQNAGEVVVANNYFYASGAGTSMYVQNTSVFRGSIINDGSGVPVKVDDTLLVTGDLTVNGKITHAGVVDKEEWGKIYAASITTIATLITSDDGALPTGGAYRMTAHISGTGTEQVSMAVFWNENGTWYCNNTYAGGTSSNHIEFLISDKVPKIKTFHPNNYNIQVYHERLSLDEASGTDNLRGYFGSDSYLKWLETTNTLTVPGTVIATNISGTNTGDQDLSSYLTALPAHDHDGRYLRTHARHRDSLSKIASSGVYVWDVSEAADEPTGASDGLLTVKYWDSSSWATASFQDFHNRKLYITSKKNGTWLSTWAEVHTTDTFPATDVAKGVTAHGYGNHASAGYSKTDTIFNGGDIANPVVVANRSADSILHYSQSGNWTGAIKITLPGTHSSNWSMLVLRITVYEYTSEAHTTYTVSGHDWTSGWYNKAIKKWGNSSKNIDFAYSTGSNTDCLIVGEVDSAWSYGHVTVDVVAHPSFYSSSMNLDAGWKIEKVTSLSGITRYNCVNEQVHDSGDFSTADVAKGVTAYGYGNHASQGYLTRSKPATPVVDSKIVGETIEVSITASTTSNIDQYLIFSSVVGSDFGLISILSPDDFSANMSVIDNAFDEGGKIEYRVYAVKQGVYSTAATTSQTFSVGTLEPTNVSVVSLNTAHYIQWDAPSSKSRFVKKYEVYHHEHDTEGSLARGSATLIYSGLNTSFMRKETNTKFHQFWVEIDEA